MLDPVGEQTSKNGRLMVYDFYPGCFYHVSFEKKFTNHDDQED